MKEYNCIIFFFKYIQMERLVDNQLCFVVVDVILEYDDGELYQNFQDFYFDIVLEFRNYGKLIQVKVCNNYEFYLRGNVYV